MNNETSNKNLDTIFYFLKKNRMIYTAKMIADELYIREYDAKHYLAKLVSDDYVIETKNLEFGDGYSINPADNDFEGYETESSRKNNLLSLEREKMWYDTENARKQFENFNSTRTIAIIASIVSIGLLILRIIELAKGKQ